MTNIAEIDVPADDRRRILILDPLFETDHPGYLDLFMIVIREMISWSANGGILLALQGG